MPRVLLALLFAASTAVAADNAAAIVEAANTALAPTPTEPVSAPEPAVAPAPAPSPESAGTDSVPVQGKKIIQPINDVNMQPPDLNALLAKEEGASELTPAPEVMVGTATEPAAPAQPLQTTATMDNTPAPTHQPGNVIQPGTDPNTVAL